MVGSNFFQRPENALKRANEFIDVGKEERALECLYDLIKSKKHRTWQKIHDAIMEKYLELCVTLKKSHIAKEGLYQYKNICQQVNIKSLEDVIRRYLALAEEKTEQARKESHQAVVDVDDLDVIASPENLLLSAVSGEDTQDRTDRAILTPWVKFLWESYRQCLDLLRNNSSVEKLYQDIARDAFKFCLKYERKTEFRKLCDNLRTHLGHIHKHQHQHRAINLDDPDSQAMHLETRLIQLNSAIAMELWQEAFKGIEDIHGLIVKPKKTPKPSLMADYYKKLGLTFWKSGNALFHAAALHKLYLLTIEQRKNMSQAEHMRLSSHVLCATLAIPIPASRTRVDQLVEMDESAQDKQRRLTTLLGLTAAPTRAQLVKDLVKYNIIGNCYEELKDFYKTLEIDFQPLKLAKKVEAPLAFIGARDDLSQYVSSLQDITATRLLKQVAQVFTSLSFDELYKMVPFVDPFRLESMLVDQCRSLELQVHWNHMARQVSFGDDNGVASQKEELAEGPFLQDMSSELVRRQLSNIAMAVVKANEILGNNRDNVEERNALRVQIMQRYKQTAHAEHQRILLRKQYIEDRKEEIENITRRIEQQEQEQVEEERRKQYDAEMSRLQREKEERERQRRIEEHDEIKKKAAREKLDQLKSTELGAKAFADLKEEEIAGMDVDDIMAKQVEQLEKDKKEMQEKLKTQEKKVDYLERAKRIEEIPLLKQEYEEFKIKDKEWFEQAEKEKIAKEKSERANAIKQRDRLSHMKPDKEEFLNKLKQDRMSIYKEKVAAFDKKLTEEKARRLAERKERRKEERREAWLKAKQEERQRRLDEEAKRNREEAERLLIEQREAEEAAYQVKLEKLKEQEEKKRQREAEIEARQAEAASRSGRDLGGRDERGGSERSGGAWRGSRAGGPGEERSGGWRDRVKEKDDSWSKPARDEDGPREDRRDDRREDRPRGDGGSSWRSRGADAPAARELPPRGGDRDREEGGGSTWRKAGGAPERSEGGGGGRWRDAPRDEPRREEGGGGGRWRDAPRDEPRREEGGGGGGGRWRDEPKREEGGGGGGRWRDAPRGDDRRGGDGGRWGRDDRAPREDGGRADDRSGGGRWGGAGGGSRGGDDRRGAGGGGGGGAWRRGGDDKPRDDGGAWRK